MLGLAGLPNHHRPHEMNAKVFVEKSGFFGLKSRCSQQLSFDSSWLHLLLDNRHIGRTQVQRFLPIWRAPFAARPWVSSFEPTGESRGLFSQEQERAEHSNQPSSQHFSCTAKGAGKLPLFEGWFRVFRFHQQTIRWLPSKSDPKITSKMGNPQLTQAGFCSDFFGCVRPSLVYSKLKLSEPFQLLPRPGRHCCTALEGWGSWLKLSTDIHEIQSKSTAGDVLKKTISYCQKYLKFLCSKAWVFFWHNFNWAMLWNMGNHPWRWLLSKPKTRRA